MLNCFFSLSSYLTQDTVYTQLFLKLHIEHNLTTVSSASLSSAQRIWKQWQPRWDSGHSPLRGVVTLCLDPVPCTDFRLCPSWHMAFYKPPESTAKIPSSYLYFLTSYDCPPPPPHTHIYGQLHLLHRLNLTVPHMY
jgi:hypothetical protein